jgi:predicted ABC-type transport system involved in lysophospholipase L1 biosynthesis ATPase subunit
MSEPVMEARDVVKFLGEGAGKVQALKGVDLTLRSGELALLMGPSGSGKTTLLSVLGCILSPSEGVVRVCGKPTTNLRPEQLAKLRREHIGFVFQSYHVSDAHGFGQCSPGAGRTASIPAKPFSARKTHSRASVSLTKSMGIRAN